jgi:hypothetical protein
MAWPASYDMEYFLLCMFYAFKPGVAERGWDEGRVLGPGLRSEYELQARRYERFTLESDGGNVVKRQSHERVAHSVYVDRRVVANELDRADPMSGPRGAGSFMGSLVLGREYVFVEKAAAEAVVAMVLDELPRLERIPEPSSQPAGEPSFVEWMRKNG